MFTVSYVAISTSFSSISSIIKMLWTLRYKNWAVAKDISVFCVPIACWGFLLGNYCLFQEYEYEYYPFALSFSFCVTGCLTFLLLSFPSLCPGLSLSCYDFFQWMRMCLEFWLSELGLQELFLFQGASSLLFPISLCTVAVHRQITWFRATVMSWPKLDEAMNLHHCKKPVSMIWVISCSHRFQFSKAVF